MKEYSKLIDGYPRLTEFIDNYIDDHAYFRSSNIASAYFIQEMDIGQKRKIQREEIRKLCMIIAQYIKLMKKEKRIEKFNTKTWMVI